MKIPSHKISAHLTNSISARGKGVVAVVTVKLELSIKEFQTVLSILPIINWDAILSISLTSDFVNDSRNDNFITPDPEDYDHMELNVISPPFSSGESGGGGGIVVMKTEVDKKWYSLLTKYHRRFHGPADEIRESSEWDQGEIIVNVRLAGVNRLFKGPYSEMVRVKIDSPPIPPPPPVLPTSSNIKQAQQSFPAQPPSNKQRTSTPKRAVGGNSSSSNSRSSLLTMSMEDEDQNVKKTAVNTNNSSSRAIDIRASAEIRAKLLQSKNLLKK
jgi:hypothetical protein